MKKIGLSLQVIQKMIENQTMGTTEMIEWIFQTIIEAHHNFVKFLTTFPQ